MSKIIEYKGITYKSVSALAKEYEVDGNKLRYQLEKGVSIEQAIADIRKSTLESESIIKEKIVFENKEYNSYGELCRKLNVSLGLFCKRKSRGYSIEESVYGKDKEKITYNGKEYSSINKIAEEFGLSYRALASRIKSGYTLEEAITWKDGIHGAYVIVYDGNRYQSEKDLCNKLGVSRNTFKARKKKGWTLEECIHGKSLK